MYVQVKELPERIQSSLKSVGYHRADIEVKAQETTYASTGGSKGRRSFVLPLNLETGQSSFAQGSWGGSNPFNTTIDDYDKEIQIPENCVVIQGSSGYKGTFATLYVNPKNLANLLPVTNEDLTERQKNILEVFRGFKASYRKDVFERNEVTEQELKELVQKGYVKENKRGAKQITTEGKNQAKKGSSNWW